MIHTLNPLEAEVLRSLQNDPHHKGAWYLQPDIAASYESYYEGKYKKADLLEKQALRTLLGRIEGVEHVVDVGCGTGHFTRWYESLGYRVVGVDVSPVMLSVARTLWGGKLFNAPAERLPFAERSFDLVSMITCTEYMPDLGVVLREARRVARKAILMGIMNKWSLPTIRRIVQVKLGKNPYYSNATFRSFSAIRRLVEKTFSVEKYSIFWTCAVFPKILPLRVARVPFGSFLAVLVEFDETEHPPTSRNHP